MIKHLVCVLLSCVCALHVVAQSADERVGELLNASDWFALEREYPALKDSIQNEFLKPMAEAITGVYFNRPDEAVEAIDTLLSKHQQEIGFGNVYGMVMLKAQTENRRANRAGAADLIGSFIGKLKAAGAQIDLSKAEKAYGYYNARRGFAQPSLSRPKGDVAVDVEFRETKLDIPGDTLYHGCMILMPVKVNGKSYRAVLDTGCPITFCSYAFAQEVGAYVSDDTINVYGVGSARGFHGVIDSICVGPITYHNAEAAVVYGDVAVDSLLKADLVVGLDFLQQCGEMQVYPQEGKVVFPERLTPLPECGRNLCLTPDNSLRLEAYVDGARCKFLFDTGNGVTLLSKSYYVNHKAGIDRRAHVATGYGGGIGKVGMKTMLTVPRFTLRTCGTDVTLDRAYIEEDGSDNVTPDDGNVGLDLIQSCRKATLNLRDMFLKIEN